MIALALIFSFCFAVDSVAPVATSKPPMISKVAGKTVSIVFDILKFKVGDVVYSVDAKEKKTGSMEIHMVNGPDGRAELINGKPQKGEKLVLGWIFDQKPEPVEPSYEEKIKLWQACEATSDCVLLPAGCSGPSLSINKQFQREAGAYMFRVSQETDCEPDKCDYSEKAICLKKRCENQHTKKCESE